MASNDISNTLQPTSFTPSIIPRYIDKPRHKTYTSHNPEAACMKTPCLNTSMLVICYFINKNTAAIPKPYLFKACIILPTSVKLQIAFINTVCLITPYKKANRTDYLFR